MSDFNNILMYKNVKSIFDINTIFFIKEIVDDYYIVQGYDTLYNEDKNICTFSRDYVEENMYTVSDFFKQAIYVGKKGYYEGMNDIEKYISETLIIVYKDSYNELLYDDITGNIFISPSRYNIKNFVPFSNQNNEVSFMRGLGKK